MGKLLRELYSVVCTEFNSQATLISGIIIGFILLSVYNRFVGNKKLINSYEILLSAKEAHITTLKNIVGEKLDNITVEKKDKKFFDNLKEYFKTKK